MAMINPWKRFTAWLHYLRHPCTIITMDEAPAKGVNITFSYSGEYSTIAKQIQEGLRSARETKGRVDGFSQHDEREIALRMALGDAIRKEQHGQEDQEERPS